MPAGRSVAVAYSGGRDSTALLHATLGAAAPLGLQVVALHVHHGLSAQADDWLAHCESTCRRWARAGRPISFEARRLEDRPPPGDSIEAWARQARYRALREMAARRNIDLVLIAHHRRDQAETFLLQALRGAGVDGLASMPALAVRDGVAWARPWLALPSAAIESYVRRHRLRHIDDASNVDTRFDRNRLRSNVWPSLVQAFPGAEASLAEAARRAQDGSAGLAEWAAVDLLATGEGNALDVARWQALPAARRSNVLRRWLHERSGRAAPATLVERLMDELGSKTSSRWPAPSGELRFHRGRLSYAGSRTGLTPQPVAVPTIAIDLSVVGTHGVAEWRGAFVVRRVRSGGIASFVARSFELRARRAGDRFQAGAGRPPRSLKLQFQSAGVPAWQRSGPILARDGMTVYVPGLGIDARATAMPGAPRVSVEWQPDPDDGVASAAVNPRR